MTEQLWSDKRIAERAAYWQDILFGHANFDPDTWIGAAMGEVRDELQARIAELEAENEELRKHYSD